MFAARSRCALSRDCGKQRSREVFVYTILSRRDAWLPLLRTSARGVTLNRALGFLRCVLPKARVELAGFAHDDYMRVAPTAAARDF
jgi:hypothetical protein